jgi:putative ABC transport system permease protein
VGEALAKKFGWKLGDTIPLQATIFPRNGSNDWPLQVSAIFRAKDRKNAGAENQLMLHWKYFDESNDYIKSQVSWFTVQLADPAQASRVAHAIDAISANSDHETKSQTESAFQQAFAKQFADVGLIVTAIMAAVFFTLLLLTGNTMAQAVRERIPELAVLKTIGFRDGAVLALVMAESVLLVVIGGLVGLAIAAVLMPGVSAASQGMIQLPMVPAQTWLVGLGLMLLIGIVVGLLPALRAKRLKIVDALAGR